MKVCRSRGEETHSVRVLVGCRWRHQSVHRVPTTTITDRHQQASISTCSREDRVRAGERVAVSFVTKCGVTRTCS